MKKGKIKGNVRIIGIKNFGGEDKMIDYYILSGGNQKIFAFSHHYTTRTYELTRCGIAVKELIFKRSHKHDTGLNSLINHLKRMLPYLADEYELDIYEEVA